MLAPQYLTICCRNAARQLRDRCHNLVLALRDYEAKAVSDNIVQARNAVHESVILFFGKPHMCLTLVYQPFD